MGKLCPRGKAAAKRKFKVYPSAYANAYGVKVCKGQVKAGGVKELPPAIAKQKKMSLRRWFQEKWVDTKTGKPCGRQKGEKRKGYPACRPSRRVSSKTPKTTGEMSKGEKAKFNRTKTSSKRINYNHSRRKKKSVRSSLRINK